MPKDHEASSCIQSVPIFKNLTLDEVNEIIDISSHSKLEKGDFIYSAGDDLNCLYVIHKGKVKIARYSEEGKEQVLRILSHGDFLGELALFQNAKVTTYAEAIEPTVVCKVERKRLKTLMESSPNLLFKMMNELSDRLEKAEALIENSNLYSANIKVARLLLDLEKNGIVRFQTTKANLSSNLGITPETFSRKLRELEDEQYIEIISNKEIRIKDLNRLKLLVNPEQI